jgi:GTP cyclohydrolase II
MANKKNSFLKKLRTSIGLSQGELAKKLNVSRPTYSLIEKGEKDLTISQSELLSALYNVPAEAIREKRVISSGKSDEIATAVIPTRHGVFNFSVWNQNKGDEIIFLTTQNIDVSKPVLVRVHSECMTGDTFHSYRCDCGEQKDESLKLINESGNGIFIYLRQEGRGIGLHEKIKAYVLQDEGYDTHEANILLGHKPDYREYTWVKKILNFLNVSEIKLLTNNPSKVSEISRLGIKVTERIPLLIESNLHNRRYFETKKQKFKHFFGKEQSNYFYQFSDVQNPQQVEQIGEYLQDIKKDPLLKICVGVAGNTHTLDNKQELKNIESIFKATSMYEGFVPILHFSFKFSPDPIRDLGIIREKMPYVRYIQLNDLPNHNQLSILQYANKFFLVDFPLHDGNFDLVDNSNFIEEIIQNKSFILLDNSRGRGIKEKKVEFIKKINKLLEKGVSDIALSGGFGSGLLDTYFDLRKHYKINFSIDAETKLKTNHKLDVEKVKNYLNELISSSNL